MKNTLATTKVRDYAAEQSTQNADITAITIARMSRTQAGSCIAGSTRNAPIADTTKTAEDIANK